MTEKSKAKQIAVEESGRALEDTVQKTLENFDRDISAMMGGGSPVIMLNDNDAASYTFRLRDLDKFIRMRNDVADPVDVVVPEDATTNFPLFTTVGVMQGATKDVRIVPSSGVILEAPTGIRTQGKGDIRILYKRAPNTWVVI